MWYSGPKSFSFCPCPGKWSRAELNIKGRFLRLNDNSLRELLLVTHWGQQWNNSTTGVEMNAKFVGYTEKQPQVVSGDPQVLKQKNALKHKEIITIREKVFAMNLESKKVPWESHSLLLTLQLMEGEGKVISSGSKQLHTKPAITVIHLRWGSSHLEAKLSRITHIVCVLETRRMQNLRSWTLALWFQFSSVPAICVLWSQSLNDEPGWVHCLKSWGWSLSCIFRP